MIYFLTAILLAITSDAEGSWRHLTAADGLPGNEVRSVLVTDSGVWLAIRDHGLVLERPDGTLEHVTTEQGLVSDGVADLAQVGEELWAVGGGGYSVLGQEGWEGYDQVDGRSTRVVFSVDPPAVAGGPVWLGANGFAARYIERDWSFLTQEDGLPHAVVHDVHTDQKGVVWLACRRGLVRIEGEDLRVMHPSTNFRSIVEGPDDTLWFGTSSEGIWSLKDDVWDRHLEDEFALPAYVSSDGVLWAASEGQGAFRYDGATWTRITVADGLLSDTVFDIDGGPGGEVWFATDRGAARWSP